MILRVNRYVSEHIELIIVTYMFPCNIKQDICIDLHAIYLRVKIDGADTKSRLVQGPYKPICRDINQYVGTVPSTFQLLYLISFPVQATAENF